MVALDSVQRSFAPTRQFAVPKDLAGLPLGVISGFGLIVHFELFVLTSLIVLACMAKRSGTGVVWSWGFGYILVTGSWLVPAVNGILEMVLVVVGMPALGALFYGGIYSVLRLIPRMPFFAVFSCSFAIAELFAASLGLSLAPVGLATIGYGPERGISVIGVYGMTAVICLSAAWAGSFGSRGLLLSGPVALVSLAIPTIPKPPYDGPAFVGHTSGLELSQKRAAGGAQRSFEELVAESTGSPDVLSVWPENAVGITLRVGNAVAAIPDDALPIMFGMTALDDTLNFKNMVVHVDADRRIQTSQKQTLVPVAEAATVFHTRRALTPGEANTIELSDGSKVLPLICYEAAFLVSKTFDPIGVDAVFVFASERGFWQPVGTNIMNRHVRAREIEIGIPFFKFSDVSVASNG